MKKRGQLTIFIIIAIVVVVAILFYFFLKPTGDLNEQFLTGKGLSSTLENTRTNLFDCVDSIAQEALIVIGLQGGHYRKPERFFELQFSFLPYNYYEGEYSSPTTEEVEERLSSYINNNLPDCFNEKEYPIDIDFTAPKTTTKLEDNEVIFKVDTDITLKTETTTSVVNIREKEFTQATRLKGMLEIAEYLTEFKKTDPIYYCINCLSQMGFERGLNVEILPFIENDTEEVIIFENQTNSPELTIFVYLNKYTGEEVSPIFD